MMATRLKVSYRPVDALVPYARNARTHSEEQVAQIAASISEFGWTSPILVDGGNGVVAGHGRLLAARKLGMAQVPVVELAGLTEAQRRAYVLADNRLALEAGWDDALLRLEIADLAGDGFDLGLLGFSEDEMADLFPATPVGLTGPDAIPDPPSAPTSRLGDIWALGRHRVCCGDTTDVETVARLVGDLRLVLLHADPPYGMGKEADGIANDNLYEAKLDAFQMLWWATWLERLTENGSAYIWGNAPDLWRLWWLGGLSKNRDLMVRNEVVWAKGSVFGMASEGGHSYPPETERCLFLMRGQQFIGNQNKADYWEGYEPLRAWLKGQRNLCGWSSGDVNRITKTQMAGHWFGKSQFLPISREHYELLAAAAGGVAFVEPYDDLFHRLFPGTKAGGNEHRRQLSADLRERRSYFDNAHDSMTDVWRFPRVVGDERFGHATPKPVAMVERAVLSSSAPGDVIAAPFGGTGPEIIAAERTGRTCVAIDLEPAYVDVMVRRWQDFTGKDAVRESDGAKFDEVEP